MTFEANDGQTDAQVKFLSRGNGYSLFLTPTEAVLALKKPTRENYAHAELPTSQALNDKRETIARGCASATSQSSSPATVLRMKLVGGNATAKITGEDELPGKSNYFIGNDPTKWRINVSNYSKVEYHNVYPGVDLIYYGIQRQLEHDFVVAPGADPKAITLAFEDARKISLNSGGDLVMDTKEGQVQLKQPHIYQKMNGAEHAVGGHYVLNGKDRVAFKIAEYDHRRPLIIDPVLNYSTYLGGSGLDIAQGIAVDSSGGTYLVGHTTSVDLPTVNPLQPHISGALDLFVTKLNSVGSAIVYSTYLGGSGSSFEDAGGIAVDVSGNAYVTGRTDSSDFPVTPGALQTSISGPIDVIVAKLNPTGNALLYSTYLGGNGEEYGLGIAVDNAGNAYVTGQTTSSNFPVVNAMQPSHGMGIFDAFVAKLNSSGTAMIYSTYLGGSENDAGLGIAVDSSGSAYVAGSTTSTNFPTVNAFQSACNLTGPSGPCQDAFITKLNAVGSVAYSTYLGGSAYDSAKGITVDPASNAYILGETASLDFPTVNPFQAKCAQNSFGSCADVFVAKLNSAGSAFVYSTYLGGSAGEQAAFGAGIAVDASGNAYVTGMTGSADFPMANPVQGQSGGGTDGFVSVLSPSGSAIIYSSYLGGSGTDDARALTVDASGNIYITGTTDSPNFPLANALQSVNMGGGGDAFVTKISPGTPALTAACTVNGSTAPVTVLVTSYVVYNANPNPASGSTCDWNPGTPLPGAFDTAAGSSCVPNFPIYTAIAGGIFSESVTVTNGSNFVTSSCPALTVQDFSLSVSPLSATALPSSVVAYTVTASSVNGFTGQINLVQSTTLPSGVSAAWNPMSQFCTVPAGGSCSATYTVTVGAGASAVDIGLVFHGTYAPVLTTRSASATLLVGGNKPIPAWRKLTGPWNSGCDRTFGSIAIHPRRPNVIYVGSTDATKGCGVYKSADGGRTWTAVNNGLPLVGLVGQKHYPPISKIAISPQLPTVLYLGTFEDDPLLGPSGRIFISLDGGNDWLNASGLSGQSQIKSPVLDIAVSPQNPATIVVGLVGDGVFVTKNGGVAWEQLRKGTALNGATDYFASISIAPSDPSTVYASGFTQYISPSLPCSFSDEGCAEVNGLIPMRPSASHDGGTSWNDISDPDSSVPSICFPRLWPTLTSDIEVSPNDRNKIYAATMAYITPYSCSVSNRGVFRSDDGGINWQAINDVGISNLDLFPIFQLILAPASQTQLYAVAGFSGVFRSTNGGNSWSGFTSLGLPVPTFTRKIAIGGNNIYALTSNGIFVNAK